MADLWIKDKGDRQMIDVIDLSKVFGAGKNPKIALNRVSWTASNGSVTGLFGKRESGKTVALRIITGIQNATSGRVTIDGREVSVDSVEFRKSFGYVPYTVNHFRGLTGEEYLNFIADIYEVDEDSRKKFMDEYIPKLNVAVELKRRMENYLPGVYKKVMLLGAMIYSPNNLILDNIFVGLLPGDDLIIKQILKKYAASGKTVLLADDRLVVADGLCDHIVYLAAGMVKEDDTLSGILEKYHEIATLDDIDDYLSGDVMNSVRNTAPDDEAKEDTNRWILFPYLRRKKQQ